MRCVLSLLFFLSFLLGPSGPTFGAELTITWLDNSLGENGFKIERGPNSSGPFTLIGTVGPDVKTYVDSGLSTGIMYCYRVLAFNDFSESDYSNTACGTPYNVAVVKNGTGSGSVASSPTKISCGTSCSASFKGGTSITLTATPVPGSAFTGWTGGVCSGTGTCVFTLNANTTVTANFGLAGFTLTASKTGTGAGSITSIPAGINCGTSCIASFANSTIVTLSASPVSGSTFAGWSGGGCSGTGTCVVTMTAAVSVSANFALLPPPTLSFSATPSTIAPGSSSTLSWASTNTTSCVASSGWSGTKTTSGSMAVTPSATTTYTLNCNGSGGSISRSVTVTVSSLTPTGQFLGVTGEDKTGRSGSVAAPNGILDWHLRMQNLKSAPVRVRVDAFTGTTNTGIWISPPNGTNWVPVSQFATGQLDIWIEPWGSPTTFKVTVTYADSTSDIVSGIAFGL